MRWEHSKYHILEQKNNPHTSGTDMSRINWTASVWFQQCSHSHQMKWVNTAECSQSFGAPIMQILSMHEVTQWSSGLSLYKQINMK